MKKKIDFRIFIIIILVIILAIMCYFYFKEDNTSGNMRDFTSSDIEDIIDTSETVNVSEDTKEKTTSETLVSTTTSVSSALTEKLELHATYYLEECFVEEDDSVSSGENILEYTNGTYLTAPYDCIITTLNIPDEEEKCTRKPLCKHFLN